MSVLAIGSVKGSPGATTAALALGAVWTGQVVVVVECDPAGGDVGGRFGLDSEPGLMSLAAASRRGLGAALVSDHVQRLPGGLAVIAGPASADHARAALVMLGGRLLDALDEAADVQAIVDCGRLDPDSPALALASRAALLAVAIRPGLADVEHLAARAPALRALGCPVGVVLVGDGRWSAGEVAHAVGLEVLGELVWDPQGAGLLAGEPGQARLLVRCGLIRSARALAQTLGHRLVGVRAGPSMPLPGVVADGSRGDQR